MINDILLASNRAKGKRPYFFADPAVERVLNITMAVAGELAVARQRVDTLERLLEQKGILTRADIESFAPTAEAAAERDRWQRDYMTRVLRIVQQEVEAIQQPSQDNREITDISDDLTRV